MSNSLNFVGRLGGDAEQKQLPSGTTVLNFNVANDVGFGDKKQTNWFRCQRFGKQAEGNLVNYLKKGQQVFISGELSTQTYESNGQTKTVLVVNAIVCELIGSKQDAQQPQAKHHEQKANGYAPYESEDVPF